MKIASVSVLAFSMFVLCSVSAAEAGIIIQPNSATTNMGETNPVDQVRDQSGLSSTYTNGVDDFDNYIATNPTHNSISNSTRWRSSNGTFTGNLDLSLGSLINIESMALWNNGGDLQTNIVGFTLLADDNAGFTSPTSIGSFVADTNTGPGSAVLPEVFTFPSVSASNVRMQITSHNGAGDFSSFGEVAFEQSAIIPEPTSLALVSLGALGLFARRRIITP